MTQQRNETFPPILPAITIKKKSKRSGETRAITSSMFHEESSETNFCCSDVNESTNINVRAGNAAQNVELRKRQRP